MAEIRCNSLGFVAVGSCKSRRHWRERIGRGQTWPCAHVRNSTIAAVASCAPAAAARRAPVGSHFPWPLTKQREEAADWDRRMPLQGFQLRMENWSCCAAESSKMV